MAEYIQRDDHKGWIYVDNEGHESPLTEEQALKLKDQGIPQADTMYNGGAQTWEASDSRVPKLTHYERTLTPYEGQKRGELDATKKAMEAAYQKLISAGKKQPFGQNEDELEEFDEGSEEPAPVRRWAYRRPCS
jgi:hypothetical protein